MPTDAVAVEPKADSTIIKRYIVPITANIASYFTGVVPVYASSHEEAASKVQAQMDTGKLDGYIEMEDAESGFTLSYAELTDYFGGVCEIEYSDIQVENEDVDPADVFAADIELLQTTIIWDVEMQAKHKAFLKSLAATQVSAA